MVQLFQCFRVGISCTLKGLGCTPEQIAQYVGWRSTQMALHYTRRSNVAASLQLLERITLNLNSLTKTIYKRLLRLNFLILR